MLFAKHWDVDLNVIVRAIMRETLTISTRAVILPFVEKTVTAHPTRPVLFCPKASEIVRAFVKTFSAVLILCAEGQDIHPIVSADLTLLATPMTASLGVNHFRLPVL